MKLYAIIIIAYLSFGLLLALFRPYLKRRWERAEWIRYKAERDKAAQLAREAKST